MTDIPAPSPPPGTPPPMHPMDPRRGESLSPAFAAILAWLLGIAPVTRPAITGLAVCGDSVLAATSESPFHDIHVGGLADLERNLRGWGDACGADAAVVDGLVDRIRKAGT